MKKIVTILGLCLYVAGCAQVQEGLCWVDRQLEPCPVAEPKDDANDALPGNGG